MALGHGKPQDVAQDAGMVVGDGATERQDLGRENGFRADDSPDGGEPAGVFGIRTPLDDEAVQVAPGEAHPHPAPGLRRVGQLGRYRVLEHPVEVRKPGVDDDGRDRQGHETGGVVGGGHGRRSSR
jgi:hypothetical protein